ncbi:hypothetical protein CDD80_2331 [Ophiocordyceps camponoti-rufipedis]|uniref:Uncharacterized protein n=1 Tax=Ophiocordyceps camponoti-rufipedis TaxID=2004952 RepID=A0A2C5Z395_9HYPO|nr:hypothetical protein CDD80_2331 [Ophiocordyceps camponoti-rufipedis]
MPHLPSNDAPDSIPLAFPPVTKDHILNCSYDAWFPTYRASCLKSRIIPLPPSVVSYLKEDGIVLADDGADRRPEEEDEEWHTDTTTSWRKPAPSDDSDSDSDSGSEPEKAPVPPDKRFPETHKLIADTITDLGGAVAPKLNWSSPKDATWVSRHQNTLKCTSPNDIYLLLKSSLFASHDLSHAFDGCTDAPPGRPRSTVLVLRPFFTPHAALEFRCFVKHRCLVGITQRDLNYYGFLAGLRPRIRRKIVDFFGRTLRRTFADASFVFDVYVPEDPSEDDGLGRVRLMDINPWAPRTDTLLFSWDELLAFDVPAPLYGSATGDSDPPDADDASCTSAGSDESAGPELRLIEHDDPAAFNFSAPQYSAHKLPREVVEAGSSGEAGLREFAQRWRELTGG